MKRSSKKKTAQPKSRQFTIRSVPPEVDRALRERAKREGRTLNDVVLEALAHGLGVTNGEVIYRDLDDLIGTMKPDPKLDAALDEMRQIDPEMWR